MTTNQLIALLFPVLGGAAAVGAAFFGSKFIAPKSTEQPTEAAAKDRVSPSFWRRRKITLNKNRETVAPPLNFAGGPRAAFGPPQAGLDMRPMFSQEVALSAIQEALNIHEGRENRTAEIGRKQMLARIDEAFARIAASADIKSVLPDPGAINALKNGFKLEVNSGRFDLDWELLGSGAATELLSRMERAQSHFREMESAAHSAAEELDQFQRRVRMGA
jgi:hypothetical protein